MGKVSNKLRTYNRYKHSIKSKNKLEIKNIKKQELLIKIKQNMKYIRFYITLGGDTGWRFSNKDEWHSMKYPILFDESKWTMEKIRKEMNYLDYIIFSNGHYCHTLSDIGDNGAKYIQRFFNTNDGVYTVEHRTPWGCKTKELLSEMPDQEHITDWNINGKYYNYHDSNSPD